MGLNKCNLPSSLLTNPSLLQHKGRSNSRTMCVPHHQLTVMAAWRRGGDGGDVKGGGRGLRGTIGGKAEGKEKEEDGKGWKRRQKDGKEEGGRRVKGGRDGG